LQLVKPRFLHAPFLKIILSGFDLPGNRLFPFVWLKTIEKQRRF
jgi:hypothetical protein